MEKTECGVLYTNRWRLLALIRTEGVDSEVGRCPLPWGVVMSKEEKRRTLALSLTHRVGRMDDLKVEMFLKDLRKIPLMRRRRSCRSPSVWVEMWCTYVPRLDVSGCRFDMIKCLLIREEGKRRGW